jgi:hypothetical protein
MIDMFPQFSISLVLTLISLPRIVLHSFGALACDAGRLTGITVFRFHDCMISRT